MRSLKALILFTIILTVSASFSWGQTGTRAADFLNIPTGAKASGLGGAVASWIDDPTAMRWNPALIANAETNQFMVDHATWFVDLQHSYAGVVLPMGAAGTFGINVTALTMGDMEETTYDHPEGTGRTFGAYSYAAGFSYARNLIDVFSIGMNVKYINETIWNTSATALAIDVGTFYQTPLDGLNFGVSVTNVGNKLRMLGDDMFIEADPDKGSSGNWDPAAWLRTDQFDMPVELNAALSYEAFQSEVFNAVVMIEGNAPSYSEQSFSVGAELGFMENLVMVRGGVPEIGMPEQDRIIQFAGGLGVNYDFQQNMGLEINYAYQSYRFLGGTNRLSLSVRF